MKLLVSIYVWYRYLYKEQERERERNSCSRIEAYTTTSDVVPIYASLHQPLARALLHQPLARVLLHQPLTGLSQVCEREINRCLRIEAYTTTLDVN